MIVPGPPFHALSAMFDAWQMFQHKQETHLWCAVPRDRPLPDFLGENWRHHPPMHAAGLVEGFRAKQAGQGAAINGFYLFHVVPGGMERLGHYPNRAAA